jgi:signal transduction histidine kinase
VGWQAPQVGHLAARYADAGFQVMVIEPLPSVTVAMTEDVLESILSNVLDNARQHGGDVVRVAVIGLAPDPAVLIEISDNGPGISAANTARVFEPFFTTARQQGGTGLGLAVVKSLVIAHGGSIELGESSAGVRLRIRLPLGITNR